MNTGKPVSPSLDISIKEENWSGANLETLSQWIQISSLQIEILDIAIQYFRSIVRRNVLLGLIFSTASGSLSLSQTNTANQNIFYNILFTVLSFSMAIFTGLIKIYQIQERLEEFIQLKQEWIGFSVTITTEIQLPVKQRVPALEIITKNKNKYLDLLKHDVDIPNFIKSQAYKHLYHDKEQYIQNMKLYKKLKEIASCTDEKYFLKTAKQTLDRDIAVTYCEEPCYWTNCTNQLYKFFMTNKNKYAGEKTALSNIILTVIMEEENEQITSKMLELMNQIRERKAFLESKMNEYSVSDSFRPLNIYNGTTKGCPNRDSKITVTDLSV